MNEAKTMYHTVPVVAELNRVKGFEPARYLRRTRDGFKLDLNTKKLWFRMRYPNGRIALSKLKITDQLAVIEARVYFDQKDTEYVSTFTAQRSIENSPNGLYIEAAQHAATDGALTAAGFGIQFIPANETPHRAPEIKAVPQTNVNATPPPVKKESAEAPVKVTAQAAPKSETVVANTSTEKETVAQSTPISTPKPQPIETQAPAVEPVSTQKPTAEPIPEVKVEPTVPKVKQPSYTADMSVNEICARMTTDEAKNYIVTTGSCKGWRVEDVAEKRLPILKWYLIENNCNDNILKAAATIMLHIVQNKAA